MVKYNIIETKEKHPLYIAMKEYENGMSISFFSSTDKAKVELEIKKRQII